MGVRYQTPAQGFVYTVVDDLALTYLALITSALVDEVWGTPLDVEATITSDLLGTGVNFADGALFAVTGYAELVFPKLATKSYTVNLHIVAPGYRTTDIGILVPAGSTLPFAYPTIAMRPLPVRLQGRLVKQSDRSAIDGAKISSTDPTVLLLRSPLYFDHAKLTTINAFSFLAAGPLRKLAAPVLNGSSTIFLNNVAALGATQTLQIGADPLAELAVISTLGPGAGQVNLQTSLNSSFPQLTPVQQMTPTGPGPSVKLARSGNAGDGLVVLNAGLPTDAIQVLDGAQTEFHLLNAISDSSGYYHVNGLAGVKSLKLQASASGFTTSPPTQWFLDYNNPVNVVDFRLKP